jgi:hypothetical protein
MSPTANDSQRLWLAGRVRALFEASGRDLERACGEFDQLVAQYGRAAMAQALADAEQAPAIPILAPAHQPN